MKRTLIMLLVIVMLVVVFVGCSSQSTEQSVAEESEATEPAEQEEPEPEHEEEAEPAGDPIVLKLGTNTPESNPETIFANRMAELVSERTDGMVTIEVYDSAQLGDHNERQEGLRMGTIDMTQTSIDYLASYDPVLALFGGPYLYTDEKHQNRAWSGELKDYVNELMGQHGFVLIQPMEMGARNVTNNVRPIVTVADLEGLKLRVPDTKGSIDTFTYLGASPTPMAFSELYMALSQKVVDGQENPLATSYSAKFYEVQKYLSLTGHQRLEQVLLFSKMNWEKLSKEYQDIIIGCCEIANEELIDLVAQLDSDLIDEFKDQGVEVNEVADINEFIAAVEPFRAAYVDEFGAVAQEIYHLIDAAK